MSDVVEEAIRIDVEATSSLATEAAYQRALTEYPLLAKLRGAYLCFLITVGRMREANEEWRYIRQNRLEGNQPIPEVVHFPVAALLIHRCQLELATSVLNNLSHDYATDPRTMALRRRISAYVEAEEGRACTPGPFLEQEWWLKGPFLIPKVLPDGRPLTYWLAARIETIENNAIYCRCARCEPGKIKLGRLDPIQRTKLEEWLGTLPQDLGRSDFTDFFELGIYEGGHIQGQLHDRKPWDDLYASMLIVPPPDRYLRHSQSYS